jgi:ankyrin repeat protein
MQRINGYSNKGELATRVLSWVTCATRPLTALELLHALAVELGEPTFHEDNLPDLDDVVSACAGLITVTPDPTGDTVRLVHYTAKEYFERQWTCWFSDAHCSIATICVAYLSFDLFQRGICLTDTEFETQLDQYPLYSYAANNWGRHASAQPIDETLLMGFLGNTGKVNACVQEIFAIRGPSSHGEYSQRVPLGFTGLHLAAYFGLELVVQSMARDCDQSHVMDSMGRTPLTWAVYAGHREVVKIFLGNGVDAHNKDWLGRTPISVAAAWGWIDIVGILLDHLIDPDSRDIDDQTPLSWAAYRGHSAIAKLLVTRGANPESKDDYGKTPLSWAAADGWVEIVQLLLDLSVDVDCKDGLGRTPISWAAENGHVAVVRLLLQRGAHPVSEDAEGHTPLYWAAHHGHSVVLRLLQGNSIDSTLWAPDMNDLDSVIQSTKHSLPRIRPQSNSHPPLANSTIPVDEKDLTRGSDLRCPLCRVGWSSHSLGSFRRHVDNRHYPRFILRCADSSCKQFFNRRDTLWSHCLHQHGMKPPPKDLREENPPPLTCPLCQRHVNSWKEFSDCLLNHAKIPQI